MNRRQFGVTFPAALAASQLGLAGQSKISAPAPRLYVAFRIGAGERQDDRCNYIDMEKAIEDLRTVGYAVDAYRLRPDPGWSHPPLTGTCRLQIGYFPAAFAPIIAEWLRPGLERYACVALGEFLTQVRKPADAYRIANVWNPARPHAV